nr:eukaryotic translation initiation factor 2-alpha kinase 1-like [Leptinotarsa decemlineata]
MSQAQSDAINTDDQKLSDVPCEDEISNTEESQSQSLCLKSKHAVPIPASILIESLIKKLIAIYESDPKQSSMMYKVMCDKLYNMNLLGESYTMSEFEGIRNEYQRVFIHLLTAFKKGDNSLLLSPMWPKVEVHSHYHLEFEEVEFIAGGGFGQIKIPKKSQETKIPVLKNRDRMQSRVLNGLEYIHSKGVVHHDIKPSNIFVQIEHDDLLIQLGDFGLACPLQSARHSLALGTKLYAAPEQIAGKCNFKSDIYSLGIVLFELVENFGTDMERVLKITDLRKGHIPSNLSVKYPDITQVISELVVRDPEKRPDTTTLLNTLKSTETQQVEQLKVQLAQKDEEIMHLRELLKSHGIKAL